MNKFVKDVCDRILNNCDVSDFKNKTILITGSNGLIGGFMADFFYYLNKNYSYNINIILTSLSKNPERLKHLINKVTYISKDLSMGNIEYGGKVDYCFYCAGYAQPSKFLNNPNKTFFLNTTGLYNIFDNVYSINKDARCVFLSSSEIYIMNDTDTSHKETDMINLSFDHKRNPYIFGKMGGEMIVNNFRDKGFNSVSVRVSLCYGPGHLVDDNRVMSDITRNGMSDDLVIKLFDEGVAMRRYTHMSDLLVMLFNISLNGNNSVYNVGGEEEVSIYNMAQYIGDFFGKKIQKGVSKNKVSTSAPNRVWLSLDRYKNEFGDINFLPFEEGIEDYLKWFVSEFNV